MHKYITFIIVICIIFACVAGCEKSKTNGTTAEKKLREQQGTIGFGTLSNMKKAGLHVFNLDSKDPLSEDYPVIGKFGFIYREAGLKAAAKAFIDFVCGTEGGKIITRENCVPI